MAQRFYNNDKYEIQNLAKFSDTLNEFLKTSAETVGKAYIDNKRREGIEKQRKYQAGDESVREEIDGNKAQLEEINNKVNEMSQKVGESTDAFLSSQNAEGKYKANIKMTLTAQGIVCNLTGLI